MITPSLIDKASTIMSGDDFIELFIIPTGRNGKLKLIVNDLYVLNCPSQDNSKCLGHCYNCWKQYLKQHGFKFQEDTVSFDC